MTKPLYELGVLDSWSPIIAGGAVTMTSGPMPARREILGVDLDEATLHSFHVVDFKIGNNSQFNRAAAYYAGMPARDFSTWVSEIAWRTRRLFVQSGQDFSICAERRYGDRDARFVAKFLGVEAR